MTAYQYYRDPNFEELVWRYRFENNQVANTGALKAEPDLDWLEATTTILDWAISGIQPLAAEDVPRWVFE